MLERLVESKETLCLAQSYCFVPTGGLEPGLKGLFGSRWQTLHYLSDRLSARGAALGELAPDILALLRSRLWLLRALHELAMLPSKSVTQARVV